VEEAARLEAKQRAAARRRGFKRSFTWRDTSGGALSRAARRPTHPVVRVCEASSLILSLMLLLAFGDFASAIASGNFASAHAALPPPQLEAPSARQLEMPSGFDAMDFTSPAPAIFPALSRSSPEAHRPMSAEHTRLPTSRPRLNWWEAMHVPLTVYLASLGVIVLRSNTDEWAALAIGIEPDSDDPRDIPRLGYVRFEYDWERDEWRQA